MTKSILTDLNFNQNEAQNMVIQNLASAPTSPVTGQEYFSTADHCKYIWNGSSWVEETNIGEVLTFTTPLVKTGTNVAATIDSVVTASSTNLITSGAVKTAIDTAVTGALIYQGTWTATSQTDYSSIILPVKKGYMYAVSGNATIDGVEWNSGDYLVMNKDVAAGSTISGSDVDKIDNTEGSDIVRLNSTQTITNKTIDADDNTIADLTTSNFKSGTIVTSVSSVGTDTTIPTEKAVRSAITSATTNMAKIATENNTALTASGGVCTWTCSGTYATRPVVNVYEISSGSQVICDVLYSSSTVTIKINSSSDISANTYTAVIVY